MEKETPDLYRFPAIVLFALGLLDLIRGFMHTFLLTWSAEHFAGFDLATVPTDQLFLLGVFGISNLLTGLIYLLIYAKARQLAPWILAIIPIAYVVGLVGIRISGVAAQATFSGRYMMMVYLAVSAITAIIFFVRRRRTTAA